MKKIISLFARNYDTDGLVRDEIVPGAEWVVAGEGVATRKFDGTAVMVRAGCLYKRYDAKNGKVPPAGWEPAQEPDLITGHWPGWVPVGNRPEDIWFRQAWEMFHERSPVSPSLQDGTYELCGPKFNGDPEGFDIPFFAPHGAFLIDKDGFKLQPSFESIKKFLSVHPFEGIVWHRGNGENQSERFWDTVAESNFYQGEGMTSKVSETWVPLAQAAIRLRVSWAVAMAEVFRGKLKGRQQKNRRWQVTKSSLDRLAKERGV